GASTWVPVWTLQASFELLQLLPEDILRYRSNTTWGSPGHTGMPALTGTEMSKIFTLSTIKKPVDCI
ncbi:MAG: hypothetical protein PVG52_15740, partial [Desulfobacterales bacterium]